ncbi:MAG: hypothetical protein R3185_02060 [Candidatus Thermoplasmatota archaeon]|nr:hypothetical protein [Candidatus Thermoplasmatota archaeon]
MPSPRSLALASLILVVSLAGCLDGLPGRRGDTGPSVPVDLHDQGYALSYQYMLDPEAPSTDEGDAWQTGSDVFVVPEGTRRMVVTYRLSLDTQDARELPPEARTAKVDLAGPAAHERESIQLITSQNGTWRFESPTPGPWTYRYEARAQGELYLHAVAWVPQATAEALEDS